MKSDGDMEVNSHAFVPSLLDVGIMTKQNHDFRYNCVSAHWTLCGAGQGQVAGSCEPDNEL